MFTLKNVAPRKVTLRVSSADYKTRERTLVATADVDTLRIALTAD
jgi:hypothetical protein